MFWFGAYFSYLHYNIKAYEKSELKCSAPYNVPFTKFWKLFICSFNMNLYGTIIIC